MLLTTNSTYTARLSAEDFFKRGVYKVLITDYRGAIDDFTQAFVFILMMLPTPIRVLPALISESSRE